MTLLSVVTILSTLQVSGVSREFCVKSPSSQLGFSLNIIILTPTSSNSECPQLDLKNLGGCWHGETETDSLMINHDSALSCRWLQGKEMQLCRHKNVLNYLCAFFTRPRVHWEENDVTTFTCFSSKQGTNGKRALGVIWRKHNQSHMTLPKNVSVLENSRTF